MKDFEKEMKRAYQKGTQNAADKNGEVWAGISRSLEEQKMSRNEYKHKKTGWIIAASAAAALVVFTAFTPPGQAAVSKIIDLFAPEKEVEVNIEGMTEENQYQLHTPEITQPAQTEASPDAKGEQKQAMAYAVYIDGSRYNAETVDGVDWIKPADYPENYPEVSMSIYQLEDKAPSGIKKDLYSEIAAGYDTAYEPEQVQAPIPSIHLFAHDGLNEGEKEDLPQWDSEVIDIYLVDNTQGGTFVITLKYFMEASEGHGERLKDMLKDFTVIPAE
jgi:hypothetical protein